jgi:hypothetical protein
MHLGATTNATTDREMPIGFNASSASSLAKTPGRETKTYLAEGGFSQSLITKRKSSNQTAAIAAFGELQEL